MELNPPTLAKKAWSLIRTIFIILKKNISKTRLFADLNMLIMKRGKIAGKSLHNLLFHHHHNWAATTFHHHQHHLPSATPLPSDDEFSCTTTPQHPFPFSSTHKKQYLQSHAPPSVDAINEIVIDPGVIKAVEMLTGVIESPRSRKSPMVKQLRITDSPFPLRNSGDEDAQVNEAAEKFILRFYTGLRRENCTSA